VDGEGETDDVKEMVGVIEGVTEIEEVGEAVDDLLFEAVAVAVTEAVMEGDVLAECEIDADVEGEVVALGELE
jgi:hypothetical protein